MVATSPKRARARDARYSALIAGIVAVLLLQVLAAFYGGYQARRDLDAANRDIFTFVGDATVARVMGFVEVGSFLATDTSSALAINGGAAPGDDMPRYLLAKLRSYEHISGIYVGYPDGTYVTVRRNLDGYAALEIDVTPSRTQRVTNYDADGVVVATRLSTPGNDNPRTEDWYTKAAGAQGVVWTGPDKIDDAGVQGVSASKGAFDGTRLIAVVGVDVSTQQLSGFLDGLPVGRDGEAFVLTRQGDVVAAPSAYDGALFDASKQVGTLVPGSYLGIEGLVDAVDLGADGERFGETGPYVTLQRGFPGTSGIDWTLYMRASQSGLSSNVGTFQRTQLISSGFIAVLALVTTLLAYRMRRPLGELRHRARTDELTGLANRYEVNDTGAAILRDAAEAGEPVCVVAMDIDNFKLINDTEGHQTGDDALILAAKALVQATRSHDLVGRVGGDEFVVIMRTDDVEHAAAAVERIRAYVERELHAHLPQIDGLGVTAGFAISEGASAQLDPLLSQADLLLVHGKSTGKGASYGPHGAEVPSAP